MQHLLQNRAAAEVWVCSALRGLRRVLTAAWSSSLWQRWALLPGDGNRTQGNSMGLRQGRVRIRFFTRGWLGPGIGSPGQCSRPQAALGHPVWVWIGAVWSQGLDSMTPVGTFQLKVFCGFDSSLRTSEQLGHQGKIWLLWDYSWFPLKNQVVLYLFDTAHYYQGIKWKRGDTQS